MNKKDGKNIINDVGILDVVLQYIQRQWYKIYLQCVKFPNNQQPH